MIKVKSAAVLATWSQRQKRSDKDTGIQIIACYGDGRTSCRCDSAEMRGNFCRRVFAPGTRSQLSKAVGVGVDLLIYFVSNCKRYEKNVWICGQSTSPFSAICFLFDSFVP